VILEMPMDDALKLVQVSDAIRDALLEGKGTYAPVLGFLKKYEAADWSGTSRDLILADLKPQDIYDSYINALGWYGDLVAPGNLVI